MTHFTIELDISSEPSHREVKEFARENNCVALLIMEYGPAGGNPLYQFSSTSRESILELIKKVLGEDIDIDQYNEEIFET